MIYLHALIIILLPTCLGISILSIILGKSADKYLWAEKLALGFLLGLGCLTLEMFLAGSVGIKLNLLTVIAPLLVIMIFLTIYALKKHIFCLRLTEFDLSPIQSLKPIEWLFAGLIAFKIIYVYFIAMIKPLIDVDAFQQYTIVAKAISLDQIFTSSYLRQFMGDKPPFPFLAQGWSFLALGATNDAILKIIFPTLLLALALIFYATLKRALSRGFSLLFTFLLVSLPFLAYHATTAYADLMITAYYTIAILYLFTFMKMRLHDKNADTTTLMLGLIFLGFTVWIKKAGLILAAVTFIMFIIYCLTNRIKAQRSVLIPCIVFALIITPWLMQGQIESFAKVIKGFTAAENTQRTLINPSAQEASAADKTNIIFSTFGRKLFLYGDWQLTWILLILALTFFYKRSFRSPYLFLLAIIFLDFSALFVQFESGETFRWLLDGTLFDRLIMNEVPLVLYFSAEVIFRKEAENRTNRVK